MAEMTYREGDRTKWVGVRPAHEGTQIAKSATATNGTTLLHTVTAGKIFFLTSWSFTCNTTTVDKYGRLAVRDGEDDWIYSIAHLHMDATRTIGMAAGLYFPLEIPAGWDIVVYSNNAGLNARGFIQGWEE